MKRSIYLFIVVLVSGLVLLNSCKQGTNKTENSTETNTLSGTISISGAFALYPMAVKWAEEFKILNPDVNIDISAGGAGKGMTDALAGMVNLAMFSRSVTQEEIDKGAWYIAVAKDAVIPTINAKSPVFDLITKKGLTKQQFTDIFINGKITNWKQVFPETKSLAINIYTRSDACGAAAMWAQYLGKEQEDLLGTGVFGDPGIADAVKNDVNGIGFNNVIYIYDISSRKKYEGLEVIPIDINDNGQIDIEENFYGDLNEIMESIRSAKYPSPPARDLYFVSKGKPTNEIVLAFLNWILTDGKQFLQEGGYVQLPDEQIKTELSKISN
jgi:phosphate transport system substrate-binding protein